jgi:hypothetical protein
LPLSIVHELGKTFLQGSQILRLALPYYKYIPSMQKKRLPISSISCDVRIDLVVPKFRVALRASRSFAVLVPVPKATVNENNFFMARQNDIRFSRQSANVKAETVSHTMQ